MWNSLAFWTVNPVAGEIWKPALAALFGFMVVFALTKAPKSVRRPIVVGATFFAGLFWVLDYAWPKPVSFQEGQLPRNGIEGFGLWISDTVPIVSSISQTLTAFLLGLGIASLVRVHAQRISRKQPNWPFSIVLFTGMITMVTVGYADFIVRQRNPQITAEFSTWLPVNKFNDILFDGLIQQMDSAMFSLIAFFIFSAAYRAFRIRSMEATLLMGSALVVMLSLMGAVAFAWNSGINNMTGGDPASFINNFKLDVVATWLQTNVQVPSLRALDFGVGLGALAMGLRLWLGLEKGGVSV